MISIVIFTWVNFNLVDGKYGHGFLAVLRNLNALRNTL